MNTLTSYLRLAVAAISTALLSIGTAHAAEADQGSLASLIPLVLIMVIFYFLLIRPQQKRVKEHKNMVDELSKGDQIITGGGIIGKIADVKDDILKIEIAEGVKIRVQRDTIVGKTEK